jgi:hypothetical protein
MNKKKKGLGIVGLGMLLIIVLAGRAGYKTVRMLSPAVDEKFGEIESEVTGKVEDTFGIDFSRLSQEEEVHGQDQEIQDPDIQDTGNDPEPDATVNNDQPDTIDPNAGQLLYQEMTGQKSYDYTYTLENTRSYDGPVISQADGYIFNSEGKVIKDFYGNKNYYLDMNTNVDGSEAVLLFNGTCYYIDADLNMTQIATGVVEAGMCYNGGYFYYMTQSEHYETKLYIYSVEAGRDWCVSQGYAKFAVISPDGRTVAAFDYLGKKELHICGIDIEEKIISLDKSMTPLSVSNDGDTVFYRSIDSEDGVFCYHQNKTTKISREYIYTGFFDRECKQIFFEEPGKVKYYKAGENSPVEVTNASHFNYFTQGVASMRISPFQELYILDTESFSDAVRLCNYRDFYCLVGDVPELYEMNPGENKTFEFFSVMTPDGPACLYGHDGNVVRTSFDGKELTTDSVFAVEGHSFVEFVASPDLSEIWGISSGSIYYSKDGGEPVQVTAPGQKLEYELHYSSLDGKCYYIMNGSLYRVGSESGSSECIASNVKYFKSVPGEAEVVGFTDNSDNSFVVINEVLKY